ncbi:hypothetical protein CWI75_16645 [Kineobactrum sediminis]|uniref:DUF3604 domain-containing protein n=1 Tax=Kineobactrum sediminis TaxID=1905677 RepID=A0A2N5XYP0_9GAMM|nr:DUF3604 domain-containing protein [Kineobactrum sediminis]PLW81256.1 hypothetical protein CWI75_16645 [Kineobactrum sediminis]
MQAITQCMGLLVAAITLVTAGATLAASAGDSSYSPWQGEDYPIKVYWGDTHLHTSVSLDANLFGARNLGPEHA